jgi:hypothetical protein
MWFVAALVVAIICTSLLATAHDCYMTSFNPEWVEKQYMARSLRGCAYVFAACSLICIVWYYTTYWM